MYHNPHHAPKSLSNTKILITHQDPHHASRSLSSTKILIKHKILITHQDPHHASRSSSRTMTFITCQDPHHVSRSPSYTKILVTYQDPHHVPRSSSRIKIRIGYQDLCLSSSDTNIFSYYQYIPRSSHFFPPQISRLSHLFIWYILKFSFLFNQDCHLPSSDTEPFTFLHQISRTTLLLTRSQNIPISSHQIPRY